MSLQRSTILLPLEQGIAKRLSEAARRQGISAETLANLWLSERLQQIVPRPVGTRVAEIVKNTVTKSIKMVDLVGKVAIITGASRGIGEATVQLTDRVR